MKPYSDDSHSRSSKVVAKLLLIGIFVAGMLMIWVRKIHEIARTVQIEENGGKTLMDIGQLPHAHLMDVRTRQSVEISASAAESKRLLIFLSAADCSYCLAQLGDWMVLARTYPQDRFEVDTIFLYTSSNELESFGRYYSFPYHEFLDMNGEIPKLINIPPKTPVTIMVDGSFKVLAAQGPEQDETRRRAFVAQVQSLIDKRE